MQRYIDAESLKNRIIRKLGIKNENYLLPAEETLYNAIDEAPTADVQPVIHGKWINHTHTNGLGITFIDYECDACHEHIDTWKSDYCPNCGAKMAEPQESEDKDDTD